MTVLRAFRAAIFWLMVMLPSWGQSYSSLASEPAPPPPPDLILDEADLLAPDPALRERLAKKLDDFRKATGFTLYLVIQSGLDTGSLSTKATSCQNAWIKQSEGMVVAYETDSKRVAFGNPLMVEDSFSCILQPYDLLVVQQGAANTLKRENPDRESVELLVDRLVAGIHKVLAENSAPPQAGRMLRIWLLVIGGGCVLGLGALLIAWRGRHSAATRNRIFAFADGNLPERLGAPCGGMVVSRKFK